MIRKTILVSSDTAGTRLRDFLRAWQPGLKESDVRKLFASRDVKINGRPAAGNPVLQSGEEITLYLPEARSAAEIRVVYEDADILLVNKPAGISVEPDGSGALSLTELCRQYAEARHFQPPVPCHRLDVRTCGLCLFAKHEQASEILLEAFQQRTIEKYYVCLVRGIMKPPSGICEAFLLKDADRAKVTILDHPVPGAFPITTGYETLSSGQVSRLKVHLITGRTHQIRAHLAALGHPILGDDLYGDHAFNRSQKSRHLKLCAFSLTIQTGGKLPGLDGREFTIDPPF